MSLAGFDKDFYLAAKLKYIQAKHPEQWKDKTVSDLEKTLKEDYNFTAEAHYLKYGAQEGLEPNKLFDADEYLAAKYNQMVSIGKAKDVAEAKAKFSAAWNGRSAFEHYVKYGAAEGVNPSNDFDESAYVEAKVAQMVASSKYPDAASALKAFKASGLSGLGHYMNFGKKEGIKYTAVSDEERVSIKGNTIALTTEKDSILPADGKTTSDDDTITGVTSSLSSERTLESTDKIDGGEGKDTLKVTLKSNFTGFSDKDAMQNVEVLDLSTVEGTSVTRSFDAKGTKGIETVKIDATNSMIDVDGLTSVAKVELSNQAKGDLNVTYAASALTGDDNIQKLTLNKVGSSKADVNVHIAGVDGSVITSTGESENFVNLTTLAGTSIAVAGDQDLSIKAVNAAVKAFDASKAKGDVTANLTASTAKIASIKGGEGDDKITVETGDLTINATLDGGKGNDTLAIEGTVSKVLQPTMTGFETLEIGKTSGAITFSAKNTSDLANIVVAGADHAFKLVNTTASDLKITAKSAASGAEFTSDNTGVTTLEYTGKADLKTTLTKSTDLTLNVAKSTAEGDIFANKAENLSLNIAKSATFAGSVTANLAQTLSLAVADKGSFNGVLTVNSIENLAINAEGTLGSAAKITAGKVTSAKITAGGGNLDLNTAKVESVEIDVNKDFALTSTSGLTKLQMVTLDTDGAFSTSQALEAVSSINITGSDAASAVAFTGDLGDTALDYNIDITAKGLLGGLTIGAIDSGNASVDVNAAEVDGNVKLGNILADADVSIDVSNVGGTVTVGTIGEAAGVVKNVTINADNAMGEVELGAITAENVTITGAGSLAGFENSTGVIVNKVKELTFVGSELNNNKLTVEAAAGEAKAHITGGIANDEILVNAVAGTTKITVDGDLGLGTNSLTVDGHSATAAITIDASSVKAEDLATSALTGGDGADTIIGTDYADTITGGAGKDTLTGGAGADKFVVGAESAAGMDTVTAFKLGEDKLIFATDAATTAKDKLSVDPVSDILDFDQALTKALNSAAAATDGGTKDVYNWFQLEGDTYIVIDSHNDATFNDSTDVVVKLSGLVDLKDSALDSFVASS